MSELDESEQLNEESFAANTPQSPMEALRARRDEVANKRDVLIQVPAYEKMGLKAKYHLIERAETDEIAKHVKSQTKDRSEFMFRVVLDTAIRALDGFFLAPDGTPDEEAAPLEDVDGKVITTYKQLAMALGWVPPSENAGNRLAMIWVFADNEFTVGSHGLMLQKWLNNTSAEVDDEFLGD